MLVSVAEAVMPVLATLGVVGIVLGSYIFIYSNWGIK